MNAAEYEYGVRRKAKLRGDISVVLLVGVAMLWIWFTASLFMTYEANEGSPDAVECEAPMLLERRGWDVECLEEPRWPFLMLLGGIATLSTIIAVAMYVHARLTTRMTDYYETMSELPRGKSRPRP